MSNDVFWNAKNEGNYGDILDPILSIFFHFRTQDRCVVVVREVVDR